MEYSDLILCIRKQCALSQEELAKEFAFTPWGRVDENHQIFRFVTSFMTKPESVDRLIEML